MGGVFVGRRLPTWLMERPVLAKSLVAVAETGLDTHTHTQVAELGTQWIRTALFFAPGGLGGSTARA